jgi:glycosyltransferase involved in cell wall biosynthesis
MTAQPPEQVRSPNSELPVPAGTVLPAVIRSPIRIGVLATHPIQYHAPLYRTVGSTPGVDLTVYFAHKPTSVEQGIGYGVPFAWDVDLTDGYRHVWLHNEADARRTESGAAFRDRPRDYDTPQIATYIAEERFDAFLLTGWRTRSDWQAIRACEATGTPMIVRGDSQLRDDAFPKRLLKRLVYPRMLRRFEACLSVGERSAEYFRYYGAQRIIAAPHFIDNAAFAARAAAARTRRETVRHRWGINRTAVAVVFAGKLIPRKRPLDIFRAVQGVLGVHVVVVGDGELKSECRRMAARFGVPSTFTGFLNQTAIPDAYAAADVLVLPSGRHETWGLVVNEAMASGLPAVVSEAAGCVPDLIREGETGYAFAEGDISDLRGILTYLVDHPGETDRMGQAAAARVAAYSPEAAASGVLAAAQAAAGKAPWPV